MKTIRILGGMALAALLLVGACEYWKGDYDYKVPCNLGQPFDLWYGQSALCEDWSITFTGDIQESRCPASVECVTAGRVDIQLQIGDDLITLGLPDDPELGPSKVTLGSRTIELLGVLPAPLIPGQTPKETYQARLVVTGS